MSLAGEAVFGGGLAADKLLAKGEGAGLARELEAALGIDMGMPKAGRGAFCLAADAAAVQSVFKRSSILSASLSRVCRHRKGLLDGNWIAISGCYETHGLPLNPRHWLDPEQTGPCQQSGVFRQTFPHHPIPFSPSLSTHQPSQIASNFSSPATHALETPEVVMRQAQARPTTLTPLANILVLQHYQSTYL